MNVPPRARGPRTLSRRLTFTYVGLLALLLLALGGFELATLRVSLTSARVATLTGDVASAKTLFARTALRNDAGAAAAQRFATLLSTVSGRTVTVVVYDASLTRLASAPQNATPPLLDADSIRAATATGPGPARVLSTSGGPQLAVAYSATNTAGTFYIQVTTSMDGINDVLAKTFFLLLVGSAVVLGAALVLGFWLTKRGLRPLERLTATAGQLASGDLAARSRLDHGDDEIGNLGAAFDDMAARIETAFKAQEESEERVRRFIADASHELRTPVTALKGYIDVMRRGAGRDPASLEAILESMQREADRMRVLVLDLLALARLDARQQPDVADVDVNAVITRLLDEGTPGMPDNVSRQLALGPLVVRADETAVATIFRNLLVNACKYAPGAAQSWTTERTAAGVVVHVADAGPGIPASDLPHIFERFYRGEKTRNREEGGSGLGLAIVQGMARSAGGDVAIASHEGVGTTVSVTIPAATTAAPNPAVPSAVAVPPRA